MHRRRNGLRNHRRERIKNSQRVHEGGHVTAGLQGILGADGQGRRLAVGDGDGGSAPVPGEIHGLHRPAGVPGEADADDHIPLPDPQQALKDLAGGVGGDHGHVVKQQVEVKTQKRSDGRRGAHTDDVDAPSRHDGVGGLVKAVPVDVLQGEADLLDVRLEHHIQHILIADAVVGHLNALHRGQPVADHFLQGLLHTGVAVISKLSGEAHHGGLAHIHPLAQTAGGHKGCLIIGLQDVVGNAFLPLGEGIHVFLDYGQNIPIHIPFIS